MVTISPYILDKRQSIQNTFILELASMRMCLVHAEMEYNDKGHVLSCVNQTELAFHSEVWLY
jgi:hypothetical protein